MYSKLSTSRGIAMKNIYLDRVSQLIQNKSARAQINAELESHILDKADYYTEIGYSQKVALQRATEEMGSPDDTAVPLNSLHKRGADKNIWSIITAVFAVFIILLCFDIIPSFSFSSLENSFRYGDNSLAIYHTISADFISLFILTVFTLLLYKAYRQKNILSVILLLFVLTAMPFFDLPHPAYPADTFIGTENPYCPGLQFSMFQPLLYPVVMITLHGFSIFVDSIFGYTYISDFDRAFYHIGAVVIYLILLAAAATLLISILRQQRMKTVRRLWTPTKIALPALSIFLLINLLVMGSTAAFAVMNLDSKIDEMQSAKKEMTDIIINSDLTPVTKSFSEELLENGYDFCFNDDNVWQGEQKTLHKSYDNNIFIVLQQDEQGNSAVTCACTTPVPFLNSDAFLTDEEQALIRPNMTLDEFLALGFYDKAATVTRSSSFSSYSSESSLSVGKINYELLFTFDLQNDEFKNYSCNFIWSEENGEFILSDYGEMIGGLIPLYD